MMKLSSLLLIAVAGTAFAQTDLINEDFQSGIPVNYTLVTNDGNTPDAAVSEFTSAWITTADPDDNSNMVAASTSYFDPAGTADRWMITPQLDLGAYGNYVTWKARSQDASFPDDYLVLISTTDNSLASFTDTLADIANEWATWTERTYNLSEEGYDNQSIYLAFVLRTYDGFKLYVDSLHVWKEDPVGVSELTTESVLVYPNPFETSFQVQSERPVQQITVRAMNGVIVRKQTESTVSMGDLPSGIYFAEIQTAQGVLIKKVCKR